MIGTTEAASSEVQPITSARLDVVANIWLTAGTASAGSPLVSTLLQASLCPSTPPGVVDGRGRAVAGGQVRRAERGVRAAERGDVGEVSVSVSRSARGDPLVPLELLLAQAGQAQGELNDAASPAVARALRLVPTSLRLEWSEGLPRGYLAASASRVGAPCSATTAVADGADALDGDLDDVTRLHPDRRGAGRSRRRRRAGRDDIAGGEPGER